jgi:hypothetical protein
MTTTAAAAIRLQRYRATTSLHHSALFYWTNSNAALQQLPTGKMEDDGPFSAGMSQFDVDVDIAFELAEQEATVWIGDGYFIDQSWVSQGTDNPIEATEERPAILHTCLRHPASVPEAGKSFAHDCHPFVAFVHLLRNARHGSEVYMSIPYLSDFTVIDQLCHYANIHCVGAQNLECRMPGEVCWPQSITGNCSGSSSLEDIRAGRRKCRCVL